MFKNSTRFLYHFCNMDEWWSLISLFVYQADLLLGVSNFDGSKKEAIDLCCGLFSILFPKLSPADYCFAKCSSRIYTRYLL